MKIQLIQILTRDGNFLHTQFDSSLIFIYLIQFEGTRLIDWKMADRENAASDYGKTDWLLKTKSRIIFWFLFFLKILFFYSQWPRSLNAHRANCRSSTHESHTLTHSQPHYTTHTPAKKYRYVELIICLADFNLQI